MAADASTNLDEIDWAILAELQRDGRMPFAELGRRVNLDAAGATERVRRLEIAGIITGFRVSVDLARLGFPVLALIRLQHQGHRPRALDRLLAERREILECFWIAAEGCHVIRASASSMYHLNEIVAALSHLGETTVSVVSGTALRYREINAPLPPGH